jgi:glucose/arabinose dehydrogenase
MRAWIVAACCVGCGGDDLPVVVPNCTKTAGDTVVTRQIAFGCGQVGAPPAPGCIDGGLTLATSPPYDGRLFAVEQQGRIRILDKEVLQPDPFLDITTDVVVSGEQGLLGLAFHPDFRHNRQFYINYTAHNPDTTDTAHPWVNVLARYQASATDPSVADPTTATILLSIPHPYTNHNAGMLEFGRDGYLYMSTGDGGNSGDPFFNGQNPNALLAKILRLDVDHPSDGRPYGIPSDNPFADGTAGAPEVFILGVRNVWRFTFDRDTNALWIADVGQGKNEELDVLLPGEQAGANLGWNRWEGITCYNRPCDMTGFVFPKDDRDHATGWTAIIGGQVYRGSCYPDLVGWYFYTDYGFGHLAKALLHDDGTLEVVDLPGTFPASPSSIHADATGELYETNTKGNLYHIEVSGS